jgi:hypothetical protein
MTGLPDGQFPWPEDFTEEWPRDLVAEKWLLACIMRRPEALDAAIDAGWHPRDMYRAQHEDIAMAIALMHDAGDLVDPLALRARLGDAWFVGAVTPVYLMDLWGMLANWMQAGYYAEIVHEKAILRRLAEGGIRQRQMALGTDADSATVLARAEADLTAVAGGSISVAAELEDPRHLAADERAVSHNWVIPGLLDAGDRWILVGWEGHGKTQMLAQFGYCVASGVHPFLPATRIEPKRVLIIDLEVARGIRARNARRLLQYADDAGMDSSLIRLWARPAGLDLRLPDGQMAMSQAVRRHKPDLIIAGPMYKMGCTEAEGPGDYKKVSDYLDRLRDRWGAALILEQHAPMAQAGKARLLRPMGSVLWQQWPEFGMGLQPVKGQGTRWYKLARFRDDRETGRDWPEFVYWRPGYGWPWAAQYPDGAWDQPLTPDPVTASEREQEERRDDLAARRLAAARTTPGQ